MAKDTNYADDQGIALEEFRTAYNDWRANRQAFPELTMTVAFKLKALKDTHVSTAAFHGALKAAGLGEDELGKNDRAALLSMAQYPEQAREILATTDRWSPQHIWYQEIVPLLDEKGLLPKKEQPVENSNAGEAQGDEPNDTKVEEGPLHPVTEAIQTLGFVWSNPDTDYNPYWEAIDDNMREVFAGANAVEALRAFADAIEQLN